MNPPLGQRYALSRADALCEQGFNRRRTPPPGKTHVIAGGQAAPVHVGRHALGQSAQADFATFQRR
ncbi:hypothetical protein, partial [Longimicrobium sp.]|uniref:hypothetical protein n=1 Tax=Longimicrobium sp. TaxID=2029185 RepID=UPI002E308740